MPSVCAGLLHDCVEDTSATAEDIGRLFGTEIAFLVDGVTKLGKIPWTDARGAPGRELPQDAAGDGARHPRHPGQALRSPRQHADARRTCRPRSRSGSRARRWRSTRRSPTASVSSGSRSSSRICRSSTSSPRSTTSSSTRLTEYRAERARRTSTRSSKLLQDALAEDGDRRARSTGRAKHLWSIYQKMKQDRARRSSRSTTSIAFRVIAESVRDCYGALGVVHSNWTPMPGPLQGLHRAAQAEPVPVAAHDGDRPARRAHRDPDPHRRRCTASPSRASPRTGSTRRAARRRRASTRGRQGVRLAAPADGVAAGSEGPDRVPRDGEDRPVPDEVYVFTPKGDVKALPKGATPIDFAYAIHSAGRRPLLGRARQRPDRPAALRAAQRRHRRDHHVARTRSRTRTG